MPKKVKQHSPTLRTIRMVETALKNADSIVTVAQLKRLLPKQVNHNVLKTILEYLEQSNKIYIRVKGITYIYNPSPKLRRAIRNGYRYPDDFLTPQEARLLQESRRNEKAGRLISSKELRKKLS